MANANETQEALLFPRLTLRRRRASAGYHHAYEVWRWSEEDQQFRFVLVLYITGQELLARAARTANDYLQSRGSLFRGVQVRSERGRCVLLQWGGRHS